MENDGPYETKGELGVPVHNVLAADVDQFDLFVAEEPEGGLDVLDGVEPHPSPFSGLQYKIFMSAGMINMKKKRVMLLFLQMTSVKINLMA